MLQRWAEQELAGNQTPQAVSGANKKRKMIAQTAADGHDNVEILRSSTTAGGKRSVRNRAPMPRKKAESHIITAKTDGLKGSERTLYEIVDGEMVLQEWD